MKYSLTRKGQGLYHKRCEILLELPYCSTDADCPAIPSECKAAGNCFSTGFSASWRGEVTPVAVNFESGCKNGTHSRLLNSTRRKRSWPR